MNVPIVIVEGLFIVPIWKKVLTWEFSN